MSNKIVENTKCEYVWYACYGSNINKERFMKYIEKCDDKTPPVENKPYYFENNIYFAKNSSIWDNGGKAFLDTTSKGHAYGRIYKITREQYETTKLLEGSDYKLKIDLGFIDGIPVYSFTDTEVDFKYRVPSYRYYNVILNGLKECYKEILDPKDIVLYMNLNTMPKDMYSVAKVIQKTNKPITIEEILKNIELDYDNTINAISWLEDQFIIVRSSVEGKNETFILNDGPSSKLLIEAMILAEELI